MAFVVCLLMACTPVLSASPVTQPSFVGALVSGSTRYNAEQLSELYVERLGETLTSELIDNLIETIEQRYLADGYFRPVVSFDDQLVLSGVVGFVVTEAALSSVATSGNLGPYAAEIQKRLDSLRSSDGVDRAMIVRFVRDAGRLPGLDVDAAIRTGADGSRELRLEFDYQAVEARMQASNRGIEELGRNILFAGVRFNSVLGWGETLDLYGAASTTYDRYSGLGISFDKSLGNGGTRIHAGAFASIAEPEMTVARTYDRSRLKVGLVQPVIDAPHLSVSLTATLQSRALEVVESDVQTRNERTNSLGFGSRFAWRANDDTLYRGVAELRKGITGLGTRLDSGSTAPDPREADFYALEFDVSRRQRFADRWRFELGIAGQMTDSILPSSERFKIGGDDYGRAYDVGEISGDRGLAAKVELGRELSSRRTASSVFELYGFYDIGSVWPEDYSDPMSAASAGLGLAMRSGWLRGYVEVAQALTRPTELEGADPRVFAELQFRF